jgi:hypothetical protein
VPSFAGVDPLERAVAHDFARDVDKVGGWPWTPEELAIPACGVCKEPMALLLQLVSGGSLAYVAGSSHGRLFVFQCARHAGETEVRVQSPAW